MTRPSGMARPWITLIAFAALIGGGLLAADTVALAREPAPCPAGMVDPPYFTEGTFAEVYDGADRFRRNWYSKHLKAMAEPSLACGPQDGHTVYRFLWLRSFHAPIAVRVTRSHDHVVLSATVLGGAGGYDPGLIDRHVEKTLSPEQWTQLEKAVSKADFWHMPTDLDDSPGMDGAQWILEGRAERHHIVDRWGGDGGIRDIGLLMLSLADIKIDPRDIY